jgi:hypothetical protein
MAFLILIALAQLAVLVWIGRMVSALLAERTHQHNQQLVAEHAIRRLERQTMAAMAQMAAEATMKDAAGKDTPGVVLEGLRQGGQL